MIISASRRTDIPGFYSDWFLDRISKGFVEVRNPFNPKQVKKVSLKPQDVDCFVFWTRNPDPLLRRLSELKNYNFYFSITITPYSKGVEKFTPPVEKAVDSFVKLSRLIGKEKTIWRYDPVLLSPEYSLGFHYDQFAKLAEQLGFYTDKCVISFLDIYRKNTINLKAAEIRELNQEEVRDIAGEFGKIGRDNGFELFSCAEEINLDEFGIKKNRCIDDELISRITGKKIIFKKDKNQRPACSCVQSIDIGEYSTCKSGCLYCYAN